MVRGLPVTPLHVMTQNGFYARLMRAQKLTGSRTHGLPPGQSIPVFPVDAFLDSPKDWVKGAGSYVCPVESEWGLWFDWTMNDCANTAVIPSVKGMNPITGKKIEGLALERYSNKCPIHGKAFVGDSRLCEECGYCWPPQNYVCAPNTLWWDGFRASDGTVRQFFFSKDDEKDIASAVIGKHNTVPAFGFCFYRPKKMTQAAPSSLYGWGVGTHYGASGQHGLTGPSGHAGGQGGGLKSFDGCKSMKYSSDTLHSEGVLSSYCSDTSHTGQNFVEPASFNYASVGPIVAAAAGACAPAMDDSDDKPRLMRNKTAARCCEQKTSGGIVMHDTYSNAEIREMEAKQAAAEAAENEIKTVAVGAGAKINQVLLPDTQASVKAWKKKNGGIIRLYFCFKPQFEQLLKGGFRNLEGEKEGYLKGLPVGS